MPSVNVLPAFLDLQLYCGDDFSMQVHFTDQTTGNPWALTGTWKAEVRATPTSATVLTTFAVDTSLGASGILSLSLSGAQTASLVGNPLFWDLQQTVSGTIKTWFSGQVSVRQDVTQ